MPKRSGMEGRKMHCDWCGLPFVPRLILGEDQHSVGLKCCIERAHVVLSYPAGRKVTKDWALHKDCADEVRTLQQGGGSHDR